MNTFVGSDRDTGSSPLDFGVVDVVVDVVATVAVYLVCIVGVFLLVNYVNVDGETADGQQQQAAATAETSRSAAATGPQADDATREERRR